MSDLDQLLTGAVRFLLDGGEKEAAEVLQSCSLELEYKDTAFPLAGEGAYDLYVIRVIGPRTAYDILSDDEQPVTIAVDRAFRAVFPSFVEDGIYYSMRAQAELSSAPPILYESLQTVDSHTTDDPLLDKMLSTARTKYLHPDPQVRREALEKLWDVWERIKTIEPAKDKKASTKALLDKAAREPNFRQLLEDEAVTLNRIGNSFMIRHTEINQTPIERHEQVDYLFQRLFAMIYLLLKARRKE